MSTTFAKPFTATAAQRTALQLLPYFRTYDRRPPPLDLMTQIVEVAWEIGANPAHLAAVIQHESRFNPTAQYGDVTGKKPFDPTKARGLIQFTPNTAKDLGVTPAQLARMTGVQQMRLVRDYYLARSRERLDRGPLDTLQKVAMATFYPAYMNKPATVRFPESVRLGNPGIERPIDYLKGVVKDLGDLDHIERVALRADPAETTTGAVDLSLENAAKTLLENKEGNYFGATHYSVYQKQLNSMVAIARVFREAPPSVLLAAWANAFRESKLDPNAIANVPIWTYNSATEAAAHTVPPGKEDSRGLFQLNAAPGAAGAGLTASQRHDPVLNATRIYQVYLGPLGDRVRALADSRATVLDVALVFAVDIERPAWRTTPSGPAGQQAIEVMRKFLGPFAAQPANTLTSFNIPQAAKGGALLVGLGLLGLGVMWFANRR